MPVQTIELANNFAGLNRMVAPQNLGPTESPDTTDARSYQLKSGSLGPRNGRTRAFSRSYNLLGMGVYNAVAGHFRILADANGTWHSDLVTWPGLNAVAVPADLTGMNTVARVRFVQYQSRLYGFNGRDRMRCLDGNGWTLAGIDKAVFTPTIALSSAPAGKVITAASISGGTATLTSASHGFSVGQSLFVDMGDTAYSGTVTLTAVTTNTFSYVTTKTSSAPVFQISTCQVITNVGVFHVPGNTFVAGQLVTIACNNSIYNGTFYIIRIDIVADQFSVYIPHADSGPSTVVGTATRTYEKSSTSAVMTTGAVVSTVATITTSTPHGFTVGQYVAVGNVVDTFSGSITDFQGTFPIVSVPTAYTFTYAYPTNKASEALTGPVYAFLLGTATAKSGPQSIGGIVAAGVPGPGGALYTSGFNAGTYADGYNFATSAVTGTSAGPAGVYRYFVVPANSKHLDVIGRMNEGLPSAISAEVIVQNQVATINNIPATHTDPQVDSWNIYRNKSGVYDSDLTSDQQDFFIIGSVALGTTTFADSVPDFQLTGGWRLRFDQNVPPTFKRAAIYGNRMFGCGFDPINTGTATVNADTTKIDFSGVTLPGGVLGCWFKADGQAKLYRITAVNSTTQITLDQAFVGGLSAAVYSIFRYPWEIYYSEFEDVEAWGPDGEGLRFMINVPGRQTVVGLQEWQGLLLVFTTHAIYAITGKGPNRTDVKMLPDPIFHGLGALSGDAIVKVDNDLFFLSTRGPAALTAGAQPQLIGVKLNTDWLDTLTIDEYALACVGTDDKDVYFSVPVHGQTMNSKTFRYERYTQSWWEETEMCPLCFIREDSDHGLLNQLYYLQGKSVIQPNSGTYDIATTSYTGTLQIAMADHTVTSILIASTVCTLTLSGSNDFVVGNYVAITLPSYSDLNGQYLIIGVAGQTISIIVTHIDVIQTSTTGTVSTKTIFNATAGIASTDVLIEAYIRMYSSGVLVATRRILSNVGASVTFSSDTTLPGAGALTQAAGLTFEIGNVGWKWLTKTIEVPAKLNNVMDVHCTFEAKSQTATLLKTDVIDGTEETTPRLITLLQKATKWPGMTTANRDYATRLSSRNGAIIRHVEAEADVEASTQ